MQVDNVSAACAESTKNRRLERTLMGGTKAIRAAGKEFTPMHKGEDLTAYNDRIGSTTLYNKFESTVKKTSGKVLCKDIVAGDDVPAEIKENLGNIDGQGRNLTAFALDTLTAAMIDGISFIFVDFPKIVTEGEEKPFYSDQVAQGVRPTSILYLADQIIGFHHENVAGNQVCTMVRIREVVTEANGEYGETSVTQIRVLYIGRWEIYRKQDKEWVLYDIGITSLTYIPLIPFYTNRTGYMLGSPPLKALAELNLDHWISSTDQTKALTFARFAMMVFTGVAKGSIDKVGPDLVIELTDPEAKYGKIESAGEGLTHGRSSIKDTEEKMDTVSMTVQVHDSSGVITATSATIDSVEANSALLAIAGALEDTLDQMLQVHADYLALESGGSVTVSRQFAQRKSSMTVADLLLLYGAGLLDEETVLTELQGRGDLSDNIDIKEVLRKLRENLPIVR